tara:strand:+ start:377 stop:616 length:240 start_codon:yes stop_codon:yes gene_type:complete
MIKVPVWKARLLFKSGVTIHLTSYKDYEMGFSGGLDWCYRHGISFDKLTTEYYNPLEISGYFINQGCWSHSKVTGKKTR